MEITEIYSHTFLQKFREINVFTKEIFHLKECTFKWPSQTQGCGLYLRGSIVLVVAGLKVALLSHG